MSERPATQHPHHLQHLIDLRSIAAEALGPGRRSGKAVLYHAPWRSDDDHASFAVYADGWKDFGGSQEAGTVYSFLQRHYGWTFTEALAFVQARTGGIAHPLTPLPRNPTGAASEPPPAAWQTAAQKALDQASRYLWSNHRDAHQALEYLRRKRGLTDETIRHFRLGYNPHWTRLDYRTEDGQAARLPPGLVIPIAADDALWALRVRCRVGHLAEWLGIPPDHDQAGQPLAKYLNASGSKLAGSLFNGDSLSDDHDVLLVEGEFDAMLAQQALGSTVAVVTLGSASNRLTIRWQQRLQAARTRFIALDNDPAGQEAASKLRQALSTPSRCLTLPQGKDLSEYVLDHQGDLRAWFEAATHPCWWPEGVPDSWRRAALNYLPPTAALVIELLNDALRAGLLDADGFTLQQVQDANRTLGYQVGRSTLAKAVNTLIGLFISKLETGYPAENTVSKTEKKSAKGRPAERYRTLVLAEVRRHLLAWATPRIYEREHPVGKQPTLARLTAAMLDDTLATEEDPAALAEELNQQLAAAWRAQDGRQKKAAQRAQHRRAQLADDLDDPHSTALPPDWPKQSASAYRIAFAHAVGKAHPDRQVSRRALCDLLGVANGTLDKVIAQAGWEATPCYEECVITTADEVAEQIRQQARACKGYPLSIRLETPDGRVVERSYRQCADAATFIAQQIGCGARVSVRFQVANRYRVVRDRPLEAVNPPAQASAPQAGSSLANGPPRLQPYYGVSYNPQWILGQLGLGLKLLGWRAMGGQWVNPATGELAVNQPRELVAAILGRPLDDDPLIHFAREELGAVVVRMDKKRGRPNPDAPKELGRSGSASP